MSPSCSIFWDHSNIFAGAREMAIRTEGAENVHRLRLDYENLWALSRVGRTVNAGVCVASSLNNFDTVRTALVAATGMTVEVYDRGVRLGGENAVDQALQVHMLRALIDEPPGVVALLTGDGAGSQEGRGFLADLERMHRGGWGVEVLSWNRKCNRYLRSWTEEHGRFVCLDHYYRQITYLKGMRMPRSMDNPRSVALPAAPAFDRAEVAA